MRAKEDTMSIKLMEIHFSTTTRRRPRPHAEFSSASALYFVSEDHLLYPCLPDGRQG